MFPLAMSDSGRVAIAKDYLRAMCAGDFATFDALMTPDVVFTDSTNRSLRGFIACSKGARAYYRLEPGSSFDIYEAFERGDTVMLRANVRADDPGLCGDYLIRMRLRDGRVCDWQTYRRTPIACAAILERESLKLA